jgi:MYXO-CTERM domain-containing protein
MWETGCFGRDRETREEKQEERREMRSIKLLLAVGMSLGLASGVQAALIDSSVTVQEIEPPPSVLPGQLESDEHVFVFGEQTNLLLESDLFVDIAGPGLYNNSNVPAGGLITSGQRVDSTFFAFDSVDDESPVILAGWLTFDREILAAITTRELLVPSDSVLGLGDTAYDSGDPLRGIELSMNHDELAITDNGDGTWTLSFDLLVSPGKQDHMRIITAPIPAPGAFALLGIAGLCGFRRRRNG